MTIESEFTRGGTVEQPYSGIKDEVLQEKLKEAYEEWARAYEKEKFGDDALALNKEVQALEATLKLREIERQPVTLTFPEEPPETVTLSPREIAVDKFKVRVATGLGWVAVALGSLLERVYTKS